MPVRMIFDKNLLGIDYRVYGCMLHAIENDERMVNVTDVAKALSNKLNESEDKIYTSLGRLQRQKYINQVEDDNFDFVIEILDE
ncbi:hypothetical protein NW133_07190 [Staphylococcus pettenkoferi]|uniref:MarR family transcriptional regulator n=1 Tax=Staphylococcus pettenkoferi TaxID=170573 RepID=A0ABT4BKV8_9STAP|nr:hypothetical protein [Staphylococcus pettenkoferi]MCY1583311.1 hypothetical protein [Staphylococcus pettenkoferi]